MKELKDIVMPKTTPIVAAPGTPGYLQQFVSAVLVCLDIIFELFTHAFSCACEQNEYLKILTTSRNG